MSNTPKQVTVNSAGDPLPDWGVTIEYSSELDRLVAYWWRADTNKRRGGTRTAVFGPSDVEDALTKVQVVARTLSARRLF